MDRLFDRLGDLLRTLLGADEPYAGSYDRLDPDMRAAYEELDAYLRGEAPEQPPGAGGRAGFEEAAGSWATGGPDEALRSDFAALDVPFGAGLAQVRSSYKRLLLKYHPDRFSRDLEKQRLATDVTQRLNAAYRRIEAGYRARGGPKPAG
jgi:DnaJ-domain-containing protein 1